MPLSDSERQVMRDYYNRYHRGFSHSLSKIYNDTFDKSTEAQYEALFETPLKDILTTNGIATKEEAQKNKDAIAFIEDMLGTIAGKYGHNNSLYDFVIDHLYEKQIGDILSHKDAILGHFSLEKEEIHKDFSEDAGLKWNRFKSAVDYIPTTDGTSEEEHFFRFWRSPMTKLFAHRGIDLSTPEGKGKADQMVKSLYGGHTERPDEFYTETPEHLVEQHERLERDQARRRAQEEAEKQARMDKPFHETVSTLTGMTFTDTTDIDSMAQQAFNNPEAHNVLKQYVIIPDLDPLDKKIFIDTLNKTPNEIKSNRVALAEALHTRNDDKYLTDNPDATFGQFFKDRHIEGSGFLGIQQQQAQALQFVLKTSQPLAEKIVRDAMDTPCSQLIANKEKILADARKIQRRWFIIKYAGITAFSALALWGTKKAYDLTVAGVEKATPVVQKATQKAADVFKHESKDTPATTTNTTGAATAQAQTSATNTTDAAASAQPEPQAPVKVPMAIKGNRPILHRWKGWKDIDCTVVQPAAFQLFFVGEFNDIISRLKTSGLPLSEWLDLSVSSRQILRNHNKVTPEASEGQTPTPFYINRGTRDYDELMTDNLNYKLNIRDVLDNLPVDKSRLVDAQIVAAEAIGPSMGWSIKQQLALQKRDGAKADQAFTTISQAANQILQQNKADTNDVEAVFWATMAATRDYRQAHPENNYLLLTADKSIRTLAGITLENTVQFEQLKAADRAEAQAYIQRADKETKQELERITRKSTSKGRGEESQGEPKKKSYKWWWIIGGLAVAAYIGHRYGKRSR